MKFLDPACGSGNFLTETFLCLRKLENDIMREIYGGQQALQIEGFEHPIYVTLDQFYGIEINDFAVSVAQTALWIADLQMKKETELIIKSNLDYLPLVSYNNIHCANALRIDWNDIVPASEVSYIIGNPPFSGKKYQTLSQKEDLEFVFKNDTNKYGIMDYVCGWFQKSSQMSLENTNIKSALVATNSITQGELVGALWSVLLKYDVQIDFAYKSFRWDNDANEKAHVHVVIVGFSHSTSRKKDKLLFSSDGNYSICKNINGYLNNAVNIVIDSRNKPISADKAMTDGNVPMDGNFLKLEEDEYQLFKKKEPQALEYIKKLVGSEEYINNKPRYVLWLVDCPPEKLRKMPMTMERVEKVRAFRLSSKSAVHLAPTSTTFRDKRNPDSALVIPRVSSERRTYIPMGFIDKGTIVLNAALMLPLATLYDFGILTSSTHMAWMRTVAGRLKSDYRYSKDIVYNNFICPEVTDSQKDKITETAQAILDARNLYPDSSLAALYDPITMPEELQKAHAANDKAVLALYGLPADATEEEIVAHLMDLYKKKIDELEPEKKTADNKKTRKNKTPLKSDTQKHDENKGQQAKSETDNDNTLKSNGKTPQNEKKKEPVQTSLLDDLL